MMARKPDAGAFERTGTSTAKDPVCARLRDMFEHLAAQPLPDSLNRLTEELERLYQDRGAACAKRTRRS